MRGPLSLCDRVLDRPDWLHTVQVVRGALRIGDGGEDQPLVVFQRIHEGDIGGMVRADIRGDLQIGA